jgi:hypothetical protein
MLSLEFESILKLQEGNFTQMNDLIAYQQKDKYLNSYANH